MRWPQFVSGALAVLALGACGGRPFPTVAAPVPRDLATGPTIDLGTDPRVAPVERLLTASKGGFNAGMFVSAFDIAAQPCNIVVIANQLNGSPSSPPVDAHKVRLVSVRSHGVTGAVEVADTHPYYLRIRHVHGEWVVDENACLWIGEVKGGDLPASIATGLTQLGAGDPRRAPAAALINSLTGAFDPATFVAAFDVTEQPCDVPGLARQVGVISPTGSTTISPQYFVRAIGPQQDAVIVRNGAGALALRIHEISGRWVLNEDACTWLVSYVDAKGNADARAVESDLRNALTAEKTIYTDNQQYNASPEIMKQIEPTLDWGTRLRISIGYAQTPGDHDLICLTESAPSGEIFSIADVAAGVYAGTYYSNRRCPVPLTPSSVATQGNSNGWG